jgi:hypothetical protein
MTARAYVLERCVPEPNTGCWLWLLSCNQFGYGQARFNGKNMRAQRLSYEAFVGKIPDGLVLDHLCRVRSCVNPNHLEPVSTRENVLRGVGVTARNAQLTHCKSGHALTPDNTYVGDRRRECRACKRIRNVLDGRDPLKRAKHAAAQRRWYARRRALRAELAKEE